MHNEAWYHMKIKKSHYYNQTPQQRHSVNTIQATDWQGQA